MAVLGSNLSAIFVGYCSPPPRAYPSTDLVTAIHRGKEALFDLAKENAMVEVRPIVTAPIRRGEPFGPILVFGTSEDGEPPHWEVVNWDGEDFFIGVDVKFYPSHWMEWPQCPVAILPESTFV
jgi:hypothetical protein